MGSHEEGGGGANADGPFSLYFIAGGVESTGGVSFTEVRWRWGKEAGGVTFDLSTCIWLDGRAGESMGSGIWGSGLGTDRDEGFDSTSGTEVRDAAAGSTRGGS